MTQRSTRYGEPRPAQGLHGAAPMMTLALAIQEQARLRPGAIALASDATGVRLTYAELAASGARLAKALATRHGVRHGDRVAVLAHNDVHTFEMLLACSRLGAALAPLNIRLSDDELDAVRARAARAIEGKGPRWWDPS